MTEFQDLRKKYNSFDWDYYGSNYIDDEMKSLKLNKDDCWWHYLTIGQEKKFILFDVKDKEEREKKNKDFDWEEYQITYDICKETYPTQYHIWWHYVNIGEPNSYLYFGKNNNYDNKKMRFNFDTDFYKNKYMYLFDNSDDDDLKIWRHFINEGISNGYLYFSKLDTLSSSFKQKNSLITRTKFFKENNNNIYFVTDSILRNTNDPYNQKVMKEIANILISSYSNVNIYFVKYDYLIKQIVHITEPEYASLKEKGFLMPFNEPNLNFSKYDKYFNDIKKKSTSNIILYVEEINIFDIKKVEQFSYQFSTFRVCGFLFSNDLEHFLLKDSELLDKYYKIISKFEILFTAAKCLKERIEKELSKRKLALPNSIIPAPFPSDNDVFLKKNKDTNINNKKFIVSFVSFNSSYKIIELINSFYEYLKEYPSHQLYLYDLGYNQEIIYKRKVELLLNKNITIYKNKEDHFIKSLFRECLFSISCLKTNRYSWDIKESLSNAKICICEITDINMEFQSQHSALIKINDNKSTLTDLMLETYKEKDLIIYSPRNKLNNMNWNLYCDSVMTDLRTKNILEIHKDIDNKQIEIYFYVEKTLTNHRTGIENYSLQLARHLCKISTSYSNIAFSLVKWDSQGNKLTRCNYKETHHGFNYGEIDLNENFTIRDNPLSFNNSIFICTEIPSFKFNIHLSNYLINENLKSIFVLHDLLPLQFNYTEYEYLRRDFKSYLYNNICTAYKIICVSNFTKNSFVDYTTQFPYKFGIPVTIHIPAAYQFRNQKRCDGSDKLFETNKTCVRFLLPGTIESRKQQILFMKIFNNVIKHNNLDIELIVFGKVVTPLQEEFDKEVIRSNGKIEYMGEIPNEELLRIYKQVDMTCVISKYEGFGMPIAESLWNGIPVLTSNYGAMLETASPGGCYLIDTSNEKHIMKAILDIVENKDILKKLNTEIETMHLNDWSTYSNHFFNECIEFG